MTARRRLGACCVLLGAISAMVFGCSADAGPDLGEGESAVTPDQNASAPISAFEQAATCDNLFRDRAAFRDPDLSEGVLRWKCGDVSGVTISACEENLELLRKMEDQGQDVRAARDEALRLCGDGFGQEYCEYNAVSVGKVVNSPKAVREAGLKDSDAVQCVFTSAYSDAKSKWDANGEPIEVKTKEYQEMLARKLVASGALQGVTATTVLESRVAGMKQGVNSRNAADTLLADCANLATTQSHESQSGTVDHRAVYLDAQRQVACYRSWTAAMGKTDAASKKLVAGIELACGGDFVDVKAVDGAGKPIKRADGKQIVVKHRRGIDLARAENWKKAQQLGVTVDEAADADRDLSACVMVRYAENGGVSWRNSDPTICARSFRVAKECNVTGFAGIPYGGVMDAPAPSDLRFDGFELTGWTNRATLPPGCKYALKTAAGKDYTRMVVCTPLATDVKAYRAQKKPLQELCRDKFASNVAMQAPVGLLATPGAGGISQETPFCRSFSAGARKISGK